MSRRTGASASASPSSISTSDGGQEKQKMLLSSHTGHFSMIRALHLADLITELNGFCGVMSIFSSLRHLLSLPPSPTLLSTPPSKFNLYLALILPLFGLFFDFLDGRVARWRRKSSLMGQELDSLADLISFGVAPACCAFAIGLRTPIDHVLLTFFVLCGLTRLARFNVSVADVPKDSSGKARYFEGTPIPTTLGIVGWMAWWVRQGWVGDEVPFGIVGEKWLGGGVHPVVVVFVLSGLAMCSKTIHIPKP